MLLQWSMKHLLNSKGVGKLVMGLPFKYGQEFNFLSQSAHLYNLLSMLSRSLKLTGKYSNKLFYQPRWCCSILKRNKKKSAFFQPQQNSTISGLNKAWFFHLQICHLSEIPRAETQKTKASGPHRYMRTMRRRWSSPWLPLANGYCNCAWLARFAYLALHCFRL